MAASGLVPAAATKAAPRWRLPQPQPAGRPRRPDRQSLAHLRSTSRCCRWRGVEDQLTCSGGMACIRSPLKACSAKARAVFQALPLQRCAEFSLPQHNNSGMQIHPRGQGDEVTHIYRHYQLFLREGSRKHGRIRCAPRAPRGPQLQPVRQIHRPNAPGVGSGFHQSGASRR